MTGVSRFQDLGPRLASGAGLAVIGAAAIVAGGPWFAALGVVAAGLMVWELAAMLAPGTRELPVLLAVGGAMALFAALSLGSVPGFGVAVLAVPVLVARTMPVRGRWLFAGYATAMLVAAYGLVAFRDSHGVVWLFWLMLVVIATDIFGYFGGRLLGGPRFWPRVSPKKTWSGTISGWIAAGLVGAAFLTFTTAGRDLVWISVLLSMASQMGDIAESAIKRFAGVKDSSRLIPGHGGLLDRFDGLLGASLLMLLVALVVDVPVVRL